MEKYILSFYALRPYEYAVNPPWWAFWEKSQHFSKDQWQQFSMTLTADEGAFLLAPHTDPNVWTIFFKALAGVGRDNVKNLQIEDITGQHRLMRSNHDHDKERCD